MILRPALCLDLDGTVRRSKSGAKFIVNGADIELMPGIVEAIKKFQDKGYFIAGISNQGGASYGFKTTEDIQAEIEVTHRLLKVEGITAHTIVWAIQMPGGINEALAVRSLLRKPGYGMFAVVEGLANNMGVCVDWDKSIMVGDRPEDAEAAQAAEIGFVHVDQFIEENK